MWRNSHMLFKERFEEKIEMIAAQNTTQDTVVYLNRCIEKICMKKDGRAQRKVSAAPL